MLVIRIITAVIFILWVILTIVNQFNIQLQRGIKSYDYLNIIPKWTFFAPNPAKSDLHLLYRELQLLNTVSNFKEIPLLTRKPGLLFFWNPQKRVKKTLLDLVKGVSKISTTNIDENKIQTSFHYIAILNFLSTIPKSPDAKFVQFAIFKTSGYINLESPELILLSDFHDA